MIQRSRRYMLKVNKICGNNKEKNHLLCFVKRTSFIKPYFFLPYFFLLRTCEKMVVQHMQELIYFYNTRTVLLLNPLKMFNKLKNIQPFLQNFDCYNIFLHSITFRAARIVLARIARLSFWH